MRLLHSIHRGMSDLSLDALSLISLATFKVASFGATRIRFLGLSLTTGGADSEAMGVVACPTAEKRAIYATVICEFY